MEIDKCCNNLKALMLNNDITIEKLANKLNISSSTIKRLLSGGAIDPRLSTLKAIAGYFEVSIDELIGDKSLRNKDWNYDSDYSLTLQVPIIHWEQIEIIEHEIANYNSLNWDHWTVIDIVVAQSTYALKLNEDAIIIVDPEQEPAHNQPIIITKYDEQTHEKSFELAQYIENGTGRYFKQQFDQQIKPLTSNIKINGSVVYLKKVINHHSTL